MRLGRRVLRPAVLLVALIGVLALGGVALRSEVAAQTNDVTVEFTRVAHMKRNQIHGFLQGTTTRPNDLAISGAVTVHIRFSEPVSGFTLASLTASNATLSRLHMVQTNWRWTFDVTPTADGAVSISIAAGAVQAAADTTRGNASGQLSMTAALGAPKVIWADLTDSGSTWRRHRQRYSAGTRIDLTVIFSEHVTVSGVPTVGLHTTSKPAPKAYDVPFVSGGGGSSVLLFSYTVPAGQNWSRGWTTITSSAISLPSSASITDAAGNAATLTLPPRVIKAERLLAMPAPGERGPQGVVGDSHDWTITFGEPVTVTQAPGAEAPWIAIRATLQDGSSGTVRANYLEGSGTDTLTFRYTVLAADNVATDASYGFNSARYVRVPDGAGVRNAAGIDVSGRFATAVNVALQREGTQSQRGARLSFSSVHDVTFHLTSSDPDRLTIAPSSLTFLSRNTDADHWRTWQAVTYTAHSDDDEETNEVTVSYRFESDYTAIDGLTGRYLLFRIQEEPLVVIRPGDIQLKLELVEDSDQIVPPGGEGTVQAKLTYSGDYAPLEISEGGSLWIAGDVEWEDSGGRRIGIPQQVVRASSRSSACKSSTIDEFVTWSCDLTIDAGRFVVPPGTPDGPFTISGSVTINGDEYSAQLEVMVGTVDELASVELDFATDIAPGDSTDTPALNDTADDRPYPDAIGAGESTTLQLAVLNEHGKASHAGEISSLVFTTTGGTLSLANPTGDCMGGGGSVCQVPVDLLTADNADDIRVTLTHPGLEQLGTGVVRALVVSKDGETINADPLTVTFLGPAESIAIGEPATAVLNYDPPERDDGGEDARDLLKLSVIASDVSGRTVPLTAPFGRVVVRDPDGRVVWSGSSYEVQNGMRIDWPLRERDDDGALVDGDPDADGVQPKYVRDADGNLQVQIDIEVDEAAQLTNGEYTIELRAIGKTAEQTFSVGGAPAQVALSEPQGSTEEGGRLTVTATVTDADGNLVGEGTPVSWEESSTTSQVVLVQLSVEARTSAGRASATYLVVGRGSAWVRASSGEAGDTRVMLNLGVPPPPALANPAESLSSHRPGAFAAWLGRGATSASALLAGLDGIDSISVWRGGGWLRYEVAGGAAAGDGVDFEVRRGEILRLGG